MLRPQSSFDRGVRSVGFTLLRFMFVLAPIVFAVNGLVRGVWAEAAMFAVAVAVGLTPEMLPVVVTTNLARGATRLARDRVVVRRLDAIQDLGGVDVLCVDKTGTLTEDRFVYAHSMNVTGRVDEFVAELAYLAVHFQDDGHDPLDQAITNCSLTRTCRSSRTRPTTRSTRSPSITAADAALSSWHRSLVSTSSSVRATRTGCCCVVPEFAVWHDKQ